MLRAGSVLLDCGGSGCIRGSSPTDTSPSAPSVTACTHTSPPPNAPLPGAHRVVPRCDVAHQTRQAGCVGRQCRPGRAAAFRRPLEGRAHTLEARSPSAQASLHCLATSHPGNSARGLVIASTASGLALGQGPTATLCMLSSRRPHSRKSHCRIQLGQGTESTAVDTTAQRRLGVLVGGQRPSCSLRRRDPPRAEGAGFAHPAGRRRSSERAARWSRTR
jgi:hypothetical protein